MSVKIRTVAFMLSLLGVLSACSTIEGAGEDIEKGGEAIQDMSEEVREDM